MAGGKLTYHVKIQECNLEAKIVLVEDSLELVVQKSSTLRETNTSPRIKCSSLELY